MAKISDASDEILERIWMALEDESGELHSNDSLSLEALAVSPADLRELVDTGSVRVSPDGADLQLTDRGREAARDIVRRHRLAERLLADVLDVPGDRLESSACQFEHLLHPDIEHKVCILLGHPRTCPHGKAIPAGRCCQEGRSVGDRIVSSLMEMQPGEHGSIAYLHTGRSDLLNKLMALGMLPGTPIEVIRTFPSYVFRLGETEYAVDRDIASAVYVRLAD
jgi:DtxR family Mn-dependent transcriptional regulator